MNNFDCKIRPLTWKMIFVSVLPSNHFRTHRHPERERERERERARLHPNLDVQARSRRRDHAVLLWVRSSPPRSSCQDRTFDFCFDFWTGSNHCHRPLDHLVVCHSPICSLSLWSLISFFCCCGGVGGGDLVVFVLCGDGFCVDSGGFFVGAGVWVLVDYLI